MFLPMWSSVNHIIGSTSDYFTRVRQQEASALIFLRVLKFFVLLRVLHLWVLSPVLFYSEAVDIPSNLIARIALLPAWLAPMNIHFFFGAFVAFLLVAIYRRPDYITNAIFFWLVLSLLKLKYPLFNGSDFVLVMMALYSIPLVGGRDHLVLVGGFNFSRLLLQWQVIVIYLVSGYDKLLEPSWRTGEIFEQIRNFEVMFNPWFDTMLSSPLLRMAVAWMTIAFEMLFGIFVYVKRTRLWVLCVGIVFHILIWLMLGLPDFASVMIIGYLIFLTDDDYRKLGLLRQ
jgi:hypothetical protein